MNKFRAPAVSRRIFLGATLVAPCAFAQAGRKKKPAPKSTQPPDLVWPLPPEQPRIRYLHSISGSKDVEPPKKKGWLEKIINEQETDTSVGLDRPAGIAVDSKDRIYVADTLKGAVFVFDLEKKTMNLLGAEGRGKLASPFGVAIDAADNVYVSDVRQKAVNVYDAQWNLTASIRKIGSTVLTNPTGLAVDPVNNRLLIVDTQAHSVAAATLGKFDQGASFGKRGEEDDEFNFPTYAAVDKQGRIYVTDTMNFCVKVFDRDFKFVRRIGEHGIGVGMFDRPKGVALDSQGNIYVADTSFSNFQIFNQEGRTLLFIGAFGEEPGSFRLPSAIFIDRKDRVFVSDQINKRVQVFQFLGGK